MPSQKIRNFSIIAHIDHGKSTLADGFLSFTGALSEREKKDQFLDKMDIERERGITIKAQTVRLSYESQKENYQLNLIDTPGHVDFSYEVSRSLAACEGALLVVDAAQGVEAQTLANFYLAFENNLEIIPVLNKIDLPTAQPELVKKQIEETMGLDVSSALEVSAKTKDGIKEVLEAVVQKIPPPSQKEEAPLKALIFDSWFESYQGVVILCRVFEGVLSVRDKVQFFSNSQEYEVLKLGVFTPFPKELKTLRAGEVGFVICGIKNIRDVSVGDTITHVNSAKHKKAEKPLKGFKKMKPLVFSGLFPVDSSEFKILRDALGKLALNDSSFHFEAETSAALGFGFRCGFLGLLHMEIVRERLEREFGLTLISTAPSVIYSLQMTDGERKELDNPTMVPESTRIECWEEPIVRVSIHIPSEYVGSVLSLCEQKRGVQIKMEYIASDKVILEYKIPLNEMVFDFYDQLKSVSRGYASMDYEMVGYEKARLVKLDVLLNGDIVDALSIITHKDRAESRGRRIIKKLKELIPRQQYQIAIQAAIGSKIIARETLGALRKDVTAKCYGGDITRKRKLLEKQKRGKKKMKQIGKLDIPQEAFLSVLKADDDS